MEENVLNNKIEPDEAILKKYHKKFRKATLMDDHRKRNFFIRI